MPESLENQFISDFYTSLLHLSGSELKGTLNRVFDGAGNSTGLSLSGDRVVINNYIYPEGHSTPKEWLAAFFPVGCIQLTLDNVNPGTRIAGTTWAQVAQGKFLVGVGDFTDKNDDFRIFCTDEGELVKLRVPGAKPSSGNVAGEYMVRLDIGNLPAHNHDMNIGASEVFVSTGSGIGNGETFQATAVGATNSTVSWRDQQLARNKLMYQCEWNLQNPFGNRGNPHGGSTPSMAYQLNVIRYYLDLNFQLGSAATWPLQTRDALLADPRYKYQELIGLWNGETRFCASLTIAPGRGSFRFNAVAACKALGAVDVASAQAGELAVNHSVTPVVVKGTEQVAFDEGAVNIHRSANVGQNIRHNNIPPSYGAYMWERIA